MPQIYFITYPETLPQKGISRNEKTRVGITNHKPLKELVDKFAKYRDWKVEVRFITKQAAKRRNKRKHKDGSLIDIVQGEWESDGNGRWATAGCTSITQPHLTLDELIYIVMAKLNSLKLLYNIEYHGEPIPGVRNGFITNYTSSHTIGKLIERILESPRSSYSKFGKCDIILFEEEEELRKYQGSDGGCVRLLTKDRDGKIVDDGWITEGCKFFLR